MDAGDDIIDVLYRYRDQSSSSSSSRRNSFYDPRFFAFTKGSLSIAAADSYGTLEDHEYYSLYRPQRSVRADIIYRNVDNDDYDDDDDDDESGNTQIITLPNGVRRRMKELYDKESENPSSSSSCQTLSSLYTKSPKDKISPFITKEPFHDTLVDAKMELPQQSNKILGVIVMLVLSYKYCEYLELLHENATWFSNVIPLEREISFRTEQGLYYSYFKEFVSASSISEGLRHLEYDNRTEHSKTINIFHRFNIHQEVFLGILYRIYNFNLEPIFFYTKSVFALQGILLGAFYLIAWAISGTWVAGILVASYVVCLRQNVTRVEYTIALREHFSLPFIFLQLWAVGRYLQLKPMDKNEKFHWVRIYGFTFLFALTWQFAQFVLLLESLTLFSLAILHLLDRDKVCKILAINGLGVICVWYCQFYQSMVLSSLVLSFLPIAILFLQSDSSNSSPLSEFFSSVVKIVSSLLIAVVVNTLIKSAMDLNDDNHILHFVKSKLGFSDVTNFETRLYLCLSAFQALPLSELSPFLWNGSLPLYLLFLLLHTVSVLLTFFQRSAVASAKKTDTKSTEVSWLDRIYRSKSFYFLVNASQRPEVVFHFCMSIVFGILALSTFRMKCFWSPYIIIGASAFLTDVHVWNALFESLGIDNRTKLIQFSRHLVLVFLILHLYRSHYDDINQELDNLRELHDPNTVDLMEWILQSTSETDAFTGSMQLLAGVKLCTQRHITNHPHFEDKDLRQRTKELYSIYAKISPEKVHQILLRYDASYIILEDSICLAKSATRCSLPDTMDLTNGFIPDDGIQDLPHLKSSKHPRFCDAIRYEQGAYGKLFTKVFSNPTFRVYKVNKS